ncbi:response regulator [Phytomonospora endophytica]|uniref:DNA-binding NarL/FixJ family response regulator n=1 Tax=Phytomonospora endophytica TaxID=714109 RepID=A0A841FUD6_9ACTN|nr:response regulator transcription factor [Phytomonospora endophytica]MBB6036139.1 DNA-binding NarL/FixJ family response regulator [Phytomonospora endophytica]GIG67042.1 DNA-binding response regulator [Phytomonospora endophytica]
MSLTVVIADDHPIVREGLRTVLTAAGDVDVLGEAADGAEAVRLAERLRPDVVLMDLRMPVLDGVAATARVVAEAWAAVLVLTTYDTDGDIARALAAGATGYLLKDTPRRELAEAVRAAARGETVLAAPVAAKLAAGARVGRRALSARELEVLRAVARGLSNPEIGRELYIGEATVKSHLTHVFTKLGVTDRTAAVTTAIARGILPAPA